MERKPLGKIISYTNRQIQKKLAKDLKPYSLSGGGQPSFLIEINRRPGINQDQLTSELKFDKATTARAVKHLEEAGYIVRQTDENDRRSYLLFPTEKGKDVYPILLNKLDAFNSRISGNLTPVEYEQLIYLLKKLDIDH
jgi:DNA-binding MarR family transcriptional regulator